MKALTSLRTIRTGILSLAFAAATLAVVGTQYTEPAAAQSPGATITWDTNATAYRGQNGRQIAFVCPSGGNLNARVWGTDVYTDDSSICNAAVHAGAINAAGGRVTIEVRPGQQSYTASTRNGVSSSPYTSWSGSFTVVTGGTGTTTGGFGPTTGGGIGPVTGYGVVAVWMQPDRGVYRMGEQVRICARVEQTGRLTFTNRKDGRLFYLPVSLDLGAGRTACFDGYIEPGDECVGAELRSGGRTYYADEFCFAVR